MVHKIAPSILSADMGRLKEELEAVETAGADVIHIDIMDGHFVKNLCMGPGVVQAAKKYTKVPLDVHLMISDPLSFIDDFADAGADMISFHQEATYTPLRVLDKIHERGILGGIAIAPATRVETLEEIIPYADYVLQVSVEPGFGNQQFRPTILNKLEMIKALLQTIGKDIPLEVDGGVNSETVKMIADAGADILVMGSAIFDKEDYMKEVAKYRDLLGKSNQHH